MPLSFFNSVLFVSPLEPLRLVKDVLDDCFFKADLNLFDDTLLRYLPIRLSLESNRG